MIDGRTIVIKGDISGSEDLAIAGRVEGSITLKGFKLTLAPDSHVTGKVIAASVIVAGRWTVASKPTTASRFATRRSCAARSRPPP